jgi:hypothetical protein
MRRNPQRDAITRELDRHGVRWFERAGGKHGHIVIMAGRRPFIPFSYGGKQSGGNVLHATRANVRRTLRSITTNGSLP